MSEGKWFRASLIISGEQPPPDQISALLGLRPTRTHTRGESRTGRSGAVWDHSVWILRSPLSDDSEPSEHIAWILDVVEPRLGVLREISKAARVKLFCGFSSDNGQGGFTLDAAMLRRLAELGVPFVLDLYPPEDRDEHP